jgi:hypothetical protein
MGRLAAVVGSLGLLMLGGCATAIRGTTQKVSVVTEPPGAECLVGNEMMDAPVRIAATPGEAEVRRDGRPLQLSCRRTGYVVHDERVEAVSASEVDDVAQRRAMNGSAVLVGTASVGIPTVAVTALTTGAGLGAAVALTPVFIGVAVLAPISVLVDATTGAYFGYPSLIPVLMTPDRFGSEGERAAYAADMHRRLDLADAALRADTAATCRWGTCDRRNEEDEAYIAQRRKLLTASLAKTWIEASPAPSEPASTPSAAPTALPTPAS